MKKFEVTGMTCSACSSHVEKAVSKVEGVTEVSVSLLTNSMTVDGTFTDEAVISAVVNAGYGASAEGQSQAPEKEDNKDFSMLKSRLIASVILLIPLMYVSMGHTMFSLPVPRFFEGNHIALGLVQLLLSAIVMIINSRFFVNGFKSIINKSPNMDALVALGSGASFIYSTYILFLMTKDVHAYMHEFYFESSAMIVTLITVGKLLESYSKGKTTNALKELINLAPKMATVIREGKELFVPASAVKKGDIFIVKPGESIPVDGIIIEGSSAVNETALTGESIPVDKSDGAEVYTGTINLSGFLKCEATKVGEDTTLSKIIKMVSDAAASKAPIAKIADKISGIFVPVVIVIAFITIAVWLAIGEEFGFSLQRGISVLVISCPCALGLATPVAIMVGNGVGARNNILFKNATSLEQTGKTKIVVLDKTGTITKGEPRVTDIIAEDKEKLLSVAYSIEKKSEHPLAKAIVHYGTNNSIELYETENFVSLAGNGLSATINGKEVYAGKYDFIKEKAKSDTEIEKTATALAQQGKTPLFFAEDGKILGVIAVADVVKEDSIDAISQLKEMGIEVVMLTGDNQKTAEAIGKTVGVDKVVAQVMPDGKASVVNELKKKGFVMMVGDGINDAPALTTADTGIAIGAGTDVAIDAADVVLMNSKLSDAVSAIKLSKSVLKNIKENLFWAFFYNTVGIPVAAGLLIPFGIKLSPMLGAAAMSLSSFCVVTNALRLNLIKLKKEKKTMKKTMKIEGMMCPHCEGRVKTALENLPQVSEAVTSHKDGTAIVTLNADIDNAVLTETVTS
ncbi:MAG: heavy metal translocating P-type ATPase [Clostridia bacterium]|nr:heavy metal translocating P-type ATPase [Clostridia bacterium]